jgi:glycolate oxidase subunit GlcD
MAPRGRGLESLTKVPEMRSMAKLISELGRIVGDAHVLTSGMGAYLSDEAETSGLRGRTEAVVVPATAAEVADVLACCYELDVPVTPRGGGTGYAGGAVPTEGGVVLSLERLNRIRAFDPLLWRIEVEAGVRTSEVRRIARENGLLFPPDPGAAESSQIGGNIATNAGGPHAFKYGVTGVWVSGIEAVVPPGDLITMGGPIRKDVAGYDLKSLMTGSEGTLGIVTAAWLKLIPAPEEMLPVVAFYRNVADGCRAIEAVLGNGIQPAALEFLDEAALRAASAGFLGGVPADGRFLVLAEADGSASEAARVQSELRDVLGDGAVSIRAPGGGAEVAALWRWREGVSGAVTAQRGGKVSEDIVVPVDRLGEAIERTVAIGSHHGLTACSWGHAGDGNVHSTFMLDASDPAQLARAQDAAHDLFSLALELGGSVSGEHGIGVLKRGQLRRQWAPRAVELHRAIKSAFDPKGLLNPGKKEP